MTSFTSQYSFWSLVESQLAIGQCRCGQILAPYKARCIDCLRNMRVIAVRRIERRRLVGACIHCSDPALKNHTLCWTHLLKVRKASRIRYHANKAKGLCGCGKLPQQGSSQCKRCYKYNRTKHSKRLAIGLCRCGRKPQKNYKRCKRCIQLNNQAKIRQREKSSRTRAIDRTS